MNKSMTALEFDKILAMLSDYAVSDSAKEKLLGLRPYLSETEVKAKTSDTTEAKEILERIGTPPFATMKDLNKYLKLSDTGSMLTPEQLTEINAFITACRRMQSFLTRAQSLELNIASYGDSFHVLSELHEAIEISIRNYAVDDAASRELKTIRREIASIHAEIKGKLENLLRSRKEWFTENYVSIRNNRFVLPVKKEYKNRMGGSVLDISASGSTYFIEPHSVAKLKEELSLLEIAENNEERKILYQLTALVNMYQYPLQINMEAMETLDFIFAKAKLSLSMKAIPAEIHMDRRITIAKGRHPLLDASVCVPLDFAMEVGIHGIVITGPNTGGKTVALKTVGLLQLMAQSGLHIPCEGAVLTMHNTVLCDIGDGQSITENLSTFSSHITNIINILSQSDRDSLILLDELGSGTDPAEGMGIAIAILEELKQKDCLFVATTHYPEVKDYADQTEGMRNARMTFDKESLKPLYRLEIGEAGESCALSIAKRLGLPDHMLERAYQEAYGRKKHHAEQSIPNASFADMSPQDSPGTKPPHSALPRLVKEEVVKPANTRSQRFHVGDSVIVYPQKKIGIVYRTANEKGEVGVQIQKKKEMINHKRLKLKVSASKMYPEDYDFSIIFDSVANRKARHKMKKAHQPDLTIVYEKEP
ncbi:MAG: DNA mismatch repair protein MutS [Lachnospiraceae bacterium]|nr:DNA mismatch repair protein MutS [Lachnospiraceae bacterium]